MNLIAIPGLPQAFAFALVLFGLLSTSTAQEASSDALVTAAIDQYSQAMESTEYAQKLQRFSAAVQMFQQAIDEQQAAELPVSADLYVNLGNAALQAEKIGDGILAFRRALLIAPSHPQASQNLSYARSLLPQWVQIDESGQLVDTLLFWKRSLSSEQISSWAAFCFLIAALLFTAGIVWTQPYLRTLAIVPLGLWFVLLGSLLTGDGIGPTMPLSRVQK